MRLLIIALCLAVQAEQGPPETGKAQGETSQKTANSPAPAVAPSAPATRATPATPTAEDRIAEYTYYLTGLTGLTAGPRLTCLLSNVGHSRAVLFTGYVGLFVLRKNMTLPALDNFHPESITLIEEGEIIWAGGREPVIHKAGPKFHPHLSQALHNGDDLFGRRQNRLQRRQPRKAQNCVLSPIQLADPTV